MTHREFTYISLSGKVLAIVLLCLLPSCTKTEDPLPVELITFSVEGFFFNMTPRVAKLAAEEYGWVLDTSRTHNTFEDIIERKTTKNNNCVALKRRGSETMELWFDPDELNSIRYEKRHLGKQQAEELLKPYICGLQMLTTENGRTYSFTHSRGYILVMISHGVRSTILVTAYTH